jgi:hypothetical protein
MVPFYRRIESVSLVAHSRSKSSSRAFFKPRVDHWLEFSQSCCDRPTIDFRGRERLRRWREQNRLRRDCDNNNPLFKEGDKIRPFPVIATPYSTAIVTTGLLCPATVNTTGTEVPSVIPPGTTAFTSWARQISTGHHREENSKRWPEGDIRTQNRNWLGTGGKSVFIEMNTLTEGG